MNKFLYKTFIILTFSSVFLFCQDFESGAFAAPVIKYTRLVNQSSLMPGARVGWIINKNIVLGAGYYASTGRVKTSVVDNQSGQNVLMNFNYGGLEFEYLVLNDNTFNVSVDMLFGGGGQNYSIENKNANFGTASLLVWEPQLNLEIKLYEWLHADAGISYRAISGNYVLYKVTRNDMQGISVLLTFKLGEY